MFKWANILSTSRNQAQSLAHHHRLGTWQWHTAHMPFYCTAPPTRRAGLLEYHRIATIAAALVSLQNHFFTSTPHQSNSTQPNSAARCRAERLAARAKQPLQVFLTCTACQVCLTKPATRRRRRGGRAAAARAAGDPMVF